MTIRYKNFGKKNNNQNKKSYQKFVGFWYGVMRL